MLGQKPLLVWFTGLSGSGKSTLSNLLVRASYFGFKTYALDGDNIRQGLCNDLAFTEEDRIENIRRIGEVAKLLDSGIVVLSSFVSPFAKDRETVKSLVGKENFVEVFVDCPLEVCEARDVKGLYKKARDGKIKNFTGISSPFEVPQNPDVIIKSAEEDPKNSLCKLLTFVEPKVSIKNMSKYNLTHLKELESEAIYVIREVFAQFERRGILFSGGKDSIVVTHLARKAFYPANIPFPLVHIDTGHNFPETLSLEMI